MERIPATLFAVVISLVWAFFSPEASAQTGRFRRGDVNGDGRLDLSDPVATLQVLFLGGREFFCADATDSNDDGAMDIADVIHSLGYLFLGGSAPPAPGSACGLDPTPDALGCASYGACPPVAGQTEFKTPLQGSPNSRGLEDFGAPGTDATNDTPPTPTATPGQDTSAKTPDRLIEESDIYKLDGDNLFVLNRYRGLQVIDIGDPASPRLIGRSPIYGYPKEMYVRGDRAYVIVSDYYTIWRDEAAGDAFPRTFYGSQVRILDISDPINPQVIGGIDLAGDCTDSRIVGEVLYVVSQRYSWYTNYTSDDSVDETQVLSVDISDPANIHVVDSKEFPRNGWEHHISVNDHAIYLASSGWEGPDWNTYRARLQYIDITDPAGAIRLRGAANAPGRIMDRWCLDEFEGVLRVASSAAWGNGDVYLTTFSVEDPDNLRRLGGYTLNVQEQLTSARFDGPRGYMVSYRSIDPLFVFDISDPAKPELRGELKMTGWLDFMVPQDDRIVALGHEDVTVDGNRTISLAVSLIDVSGSGEPKLLSRVVLDGIWGWVPGSRDDFAKVFKTLPDQGLVLFPFQAWDPATWRSIGGVQLIDLSRDALKLRGLIKDCGWVERGIPKDEGTVLTLSSEVLQIVDIRDRDKPAVLGRLDLARNVLDFALLGAEHTVQLAGDPNQGDMTLVVTPRSDPDAAVPVASLHLGAPWGRMFANGSFVYVTSTRTDPGTADQPSRNVTSIQVVDLTDPAAPKLRGSVDLPDELWIGRGWYWCWGDEVAQVDGSILAFHRSRYFWAAMDVGPTGIGIPQWETAQEIYIADLSDPDSPRLASTVKFDGADWAWGLKASGRTLYLSSYSSFQEDGGFWAAKYYLHRIRITDPANPLLLKPVNIPGMFIDASASGQIIYSSESWWDQATSASKNLFHALEIAEDTAYLLGTVDLPGYAYGIQVKDGAAFLSTQLWSPRLLLDGKSQEWVYQSSLVTIDLTDPGALRIAGTADLSKLDSPYLQKVQDGRAFLQSWMGITVFNVRDIGNPSFEEFFRTQGWAQDIVIGEGAAYVPSGYYGVQVLKLGG